MATRVRARARQAWLVLLVLVASTVLVATPAVAAGTTTTLTGTISPTAVAYGGSVTVTGVLKNAVTNAVLPGQTVTLEGRPASSASFTTLATTTTNGSGAYSFTRTNQTENVTFRARFTAAATYAGSLSPLRKLTVAAPLDNLVMDPSTSTGTYNTSRTWSGTTAPALNGSYVDVQHNVGGVWQFVGNGYISNGSFTASFALSDLGVQSYRLSVPATTSLGAKTSAPVKITVGQLTISTGNLVAARQYKAYSTQLVAAYGQAPLHWTVGEALPPGMSLSDGGVLSGTPTVVSSTPLTFHVSDSIGQTADKSLTLNVLEPVAPTFLDTRLPDGQLGVPYDYRLRVAGGTAPVTLSLTSGTLPDGLTFDAAHRALSGTPTAVVTRSLTFRATDSAGHVTNKTLAMAVGPAGDWDQTGHDDGQSRFNPNENAIGADNADVLGVEWKTPTTYANVVRAGRVYSSGALPGTSGTSGITVRDISTGEVQWKVATGSACQQMALTATSVLCDTSSEIAAYSLTTHARLWTTTDTDPGSQFTTMVVSGGYVVAGRSDTAGVAAYRASDGVYRWLKAMPDVAYNVVVVSGKVYALDQSHNVRSWTLNDTGTSGWTLSATHINQLIGTQGLLLARESDVGVTSVTWRSLVNGSVTKTFTSSRQIYGDLVADDHNVYLPTSLFDEFGGSSQMGVTAVSLATGTEQWDVTTGNPIRAGMAVGGHILWVHASDLARYRQPSELVAVDTTNGTVVRRYDVSDTSSAPPIVANGRVILPIIYETQVWGVSSPVPQVTTNILPVSWTSSPYAAHLSGQGGNAPYSYDVTAGALPAGITLGSDGQFAGTPTAVGVATFTVRITDDNGRSTRQRLTLATRTAATGGWVTNGGVPGHTGLVQGEAAIDPDTISTFSRQYTTAAASTVTAPPGGGAEEPLVSGSRVFGITSDGALAAYSSTNGLNRAALWTRPPLADSQPFRGTPTLVGTPTSGTLYAWTSDNLVVAVSATSGAVLWSTPIPGANGNPAAASPLVVGGRLFLETGGQVVAVDLSTHAVAWSVPMPGSNYGLHVSMAAYSTWVLAIDGCDVVALNASDGSVKWRSAVPATSSGCSPWSGNKAVVVMDKTVYFDMQYYGVAAFNVTTGAVLWRATPPTSGSAATVTDQWVITASPYDGITVLDRVTGEVVGQIDATQVSPSSGVTAVGDLVLYTTTTGRVGAVDLPTMTQIWTSSIVTPDVPTSRPVVAGGRIYVYSDDNAAATYRIVGLGP